MRLLCPLCLFYFFSFYKQNNSSESKVKFRQASNRCKRVLEAAEVLEVE